MPVILIAEDEMPTRRGILNTLKEWSQGKHELQTAENGVQALQFFRDRPVDLLITDIRMPGLSGVELLQALRDEEREVISIILTGYAEFEYAQTAMKLGAVNYILKPVEPDDLVHAVEEALAKAGTQHQPVIGLQQPASVKNEFIRKALQYMHKSISNPSLGIREVAEHVHLSPSYFSALFKDAMNVTFSDYMIHNRIELAKQLLRETDRKVYEIAEAAGFNSSKYFVKAFRNLEGVTPKQFRKQAM